MSATVPRSDRPYWALRAAETALLVTSLAGMGLFAWSLVDIVRIETTPASAGTVPALAWPGIFIFFGSMVALQAVRVFLNRYRRDDGTPRGGERAATTTTRELLADPPRTGEPVAGARTDAMDA